MTDSAASIPAICSNCEALFPSGIGLGGGATMRVEGVIAGPCPHCGGMGVVPDGMYGALSSAAVAFSSERAPPEQFQQLLATLRRALSERWSHEELSRHVGEETPGLSSVSDALPRSRTELYAALLVLIAFITLLVNTCSNDPDNRLSDNVMNRLIDQAIKQSCER